jgi:hypothetical protein
VAKIQEKNIVITVSKLVKDGNAEDLTIPQDVADALVSVAEELLGDGVVVEINLA